ncbi:tail fiber assembly protein [Escherichia coli]|uniref:tail fiber assembly protein n=1 Tax=Escherichia coli TaxID=562 RepID=UPI000A380E98
MQDQPGETGHNTKTRDAKETTNPRDYPEKTTTNTTSTPDQKSDADKAATETNTQQSPAVDAAETHRQARNDTAITPIKPIQLKIKDGRKPTHAETTPLNAVPEYINQVTPTHTTNAPNGTRPELPEA